MLVITGPPTHSVGASILLLSVVCRMSGSVTLHGGPAGGFTRAGQAMTSCRLKSNYSSRVTLHGGPVVFRPVWATPCLKASFPGSSSGHVRHSLSNIT